MIIEFCDWSQISSPLGCEVNGTTLTSSQSSLLLYLAFSLSLKIYIHKDLYIPTVSEGNNNRQKNRIKFVFICRVNLWQETMVMVGSM